MNIAIVGTGYVGLVSGTVNLNFPIFNTKKAGKLPAFS